MKDFETAANCEARASVINVMMLVTAVEIRPHLVTDHLPLPLAVVLTQHLGLVRRQVHRRLQQERWHVRQQRHRHTGDTTLADSGATGAIAVRPSSENWVAMKA